MAEETKPEETTPPEVDAAEEEAYGKFAKFLDRYSAEKAPKDPPPAKTIKPSGGFLDSFLNF